MQEAIDKLTRASDKALKDLKEWFRDLVIADDRPPNWKIDAHVPTPEEQARFQVKLDAALKRWEERKAAEQQEETGGENDKKDKH